MNGKTIFNLWMLVIILAGIALLNWLARKDTPKGESSLPNNTNIVVIDGCEYIQGHVRMSGMPPTYEHKGDCRNPIHKKP